MANQSSNYIVIGAPSQTNVTVSPAVRQPPQSQLRQVLVTPLSSSGSNQAHRLMSNQPFVNPPIKKVMLKAVNRGSKGKEPKTFTLRDVRPEAMTSCAAVKCLIKAQLTQDITEEDFDIGFLQGNTVVSIRSKADLDELWEGLRRGINTTLWCDGMNGEAHSSSLGQKRSAQDTDEEGEKIKDKKKKRKKKDGESKEEKVEETIQALQDKQGKEFTPMQYRIWAEMHVGGYQPSLDEAPSNSMFLRAGGAAIKRRTTADIVSQAINQLAPALSPSVALPTSHSSPAKLIDNRSKCYKQLGELKNLMQAGILSDEEYSREREAIMGTLKSLGQ